MSPIGQKTPARTKLSVVERDVPHLRIALSGVVTRRLKRGIARSPEFWIVRNVYCPKTVVRKCKIRG